jgi:hypothetical protein
VSLKLTLKHKSTLTFGALKVSRIFMDPLFVTVQILVCIE